MEKLLPWEGSGERVVFDDSTRRAFAGIHISGELSRKHVFRSR